MAQLISRRQLLRKMASLAGGLGILSLGAQCGPTPTPQVIEKEITKVVERPVEKVVEKVVKETVVVEKPGVLKVQFLVDDWYWQKMKFGYAHERWQAKHRDEIRIDCDITPEGYQTKVLAMIKEGKPYWSGYMRWIDTNFDTDRRAGMLQPVEPYLRASKRPEAATYFDEIFATARESATWEGQMWALPWDIEFWACSYHKPFYQGIGSPEGPAETFDEWEKQMLEIKNKYGKEGIYPFVMGTEYFRIAWCMLNSSVDKPPFLKEGGHTFLDYHHDAYKEVLSRLKRWKDLGLWTPEHEPNMTAMFDRRKVATTYAHISWGQKISGMLYGQENMGVAQMAVPKKGMTPRTWVQFNGTELFKNAEYCQECVDWQLEAFTWTVPALQEGILGYFHGPIWKTSWKKIIEPDTTGQYNFIKEMRPMIEGSFLWPRGFPRETYAPVGGAWIRKYLVEGVSLEKSVEGVDKEIRDIAAKAL